MVNRKGGFGYEEVRCLDYGQKLRSAEIGVRDIPATLVTFSGLFGSKQSDVKIKNVKTGDEMTIEEFNAMPRG